MNQSKNIGTKILALFMVFGLFSCHKDHRALVISKVQSVSKLATTETVIDKTVVGTKTKRILGLVRLNQANFVAYTQATIWTGIDLKKLKPEDVKINDHEISLLLPPVEVIDFRYPFDKFRIDTALLKDAWINRFSIIDYEQFYRQAELDIRHQLQYTGVIEATEEKTRKLLTGLLKNMGFEAIFIEFKPAGKLFTPLIIDGIQ